MVEEKTARGDIKLVSPQEIWEKYLVDVKNQAAGGEFKEDGVYDNHLMGFGSSREDAQRVREILLQRGYTPLWKKFYSEKVGGKLVPDYHKREGLLAPDEIIVIQMGNYPSTTWDFGRERPCWIQLHPYGPKADGIGTSRSSQKLAAEALKIFEIFEENKISFSATVDDFSDVSEPESHQAVKVDFLPDGKSEITIIPYSI